jgi:hypothetical protein
MRGYLAALALVALSGGAPDAERVQVVSLLKESQVLVSFRLVNGFSEDLAAAMRSGLPTTISYEVELRRGVFLWFDRTLRTATVIASAKFDNLTRHHQLTRTVDGRGEEPRVTESEEAVREWLTGVDRLPLFVTDGLEPNVEYYVKVRARRRPRVSWFLWPWSRGDAAGSAKFTYVR